MPNTEPIKKTPDPFYLQALLVVEVVKRILKSKADLNLSADPTIKLIPIVDFMKRMRVTGLSKFDEKTYISTVNFYKNQNDLAQHKALGALVVYFPESYIVNFFQKLNYSMVADEDDSLALEDACGTFCNLVAGSFKSGLTQFGFREPVMSHFLAFQNDVLNGVEYDQSQSELYEISFSILGEKRLVVDLTMGPIPKLSDF